MEIEVFTLCDAAADYQGRLSILGIFDTIFGPTLPVVHPYCSVALRLRFAKIEEGKHNLALHIVDSDGEMIIPPLSGGYDVKLGKNERQGAVNLVLNLQAVSFKRFGEHAINLAIDGRELGSLPFWIRQRE